METYEGRIKDIRINGKPESCMAEVICRQAIIGVLEDVAIDSGRDDLEKVADLLMAAMIDWDAELPENPFHNDVLTAIGIARARIANAKCAAFCEGQQSMLAAGFRKVRSEGGKNGEMGIDRRGCGVAAKSLYPQLRAFYKVQERKLAGEPSG